ncbi:MAG: YARHG domain-containing protein [Proteobacteria bacterium]|nr:YARHG domain-containing protein [Pseudomonadota bacterium]
MPGLDIRIGLVALAAFAGSAEPARAQMSCDELWYQRNAIYKDAGYCFKTASAIRTFGNAGCQFDNVNDVPLSANQRREIAAIVAQERRRRCPR